MPPFDPERFLAQLTTRPGVYQMLDDSPVPRPAVVNETVGLARKYGHPGTVGLVNAEGIASNCAPCALRCRYSSGNRTS